MAKSNAQPIQEMPTDGVPPAGQDVVINQNQTIDNIPDQIEFDIGGEAPAAAEGGEQETQQQEQQPPRQQEPKRPRSDPQRRINQAVARQREAETVAERLQRENQELLAELEGGKKQTEQEKARAEANERAALIHHERAEKANLDLAKRDYQSAIEAGDAAKQTDAAARISAAQNQLAQVDAWRAAHPAPTAEQQQQRQQEEPRRPEQQEEQRQQAPTPLRSNIPEVQKFLDTNKWIDPANQEFDRDMHVEAVRYCAALEQSLKRQGRDSEINTPAFFAKVNTHMRDMFPDEIGDDGSGGDAGDGGEGDDYVIPAINAPRVPPSRSQQQNQQRMPQMSRDNTVLPANGQAAPGPQKNQGNMRVELSPDEKEIAVRTFEAGTMGNFFRTGKPVANPQQAVEQWAFRKLPPDRQQKVLSSVKR